MSEKLDDVITALRRVLPDEGRVLTDVPMAAYTSFRAGGRAACLVAPASVDELRAAAAVIAGAGVPCVFMGKGTNLLVADGGYGGVLVRVDEPLDRVETAGRVITAQAGASLAKLAEAAAAAGLSGLEFAAGIPGNVGGAVRMNAGAFEGEIAGVLSAAELMSVSDGETGGVAIRTARADELAFSYRHSVIGETGEAVISATFEARPGDIGEIRERMREYARRRAEKQPTDMPSAGSFFKRPPGRFAGKLIQDAGLSGLTCGGARVSEKHAGFIVNAGGATARDILDLAEIVRHTVRDRFGVMLEAEVRVIGEDI